MKYIMCENHTTVHGLLILTLHHFTQMMMLWCRCPPMFWRYMLEWCATLHGNFFVIDDACGPDVVLWPHKVKNREEKTIVQCYALKMSRVDACFRKPCFVLKRPFWKGLWRNLRNLRNWSSLGGRCFHPPAYTKRSCLVWKVIRNVGSWARLHERGSVRAARHAMMYRIFPPQIFTQNAAEHWQFVKCFSGSLAG